MQGMLAASATLTPFTAAQSSAYSPLPVHSRSLLHTSRHIFQGSHLISTIAKSRGCRQAQRCRVLTRSVLDVNEDTWEEEVLKADVPVLVDFWATWCGPCKLIAPLLDQLEKEYGDALKIVKVEADPCPNLVEKYKVYGLPTLILYRNGEMVPGSQQEGAVGKPKILEYLEKHGVAPVAK